MKPGQKITGVGENQLSYRYPFSSYNKSLSSPIIPNNTYYSTLQSSFIWVDIIRFISACKAALRAFSSRSPVLVTLWRLVTPLILSSMTPLAAVSCFLLSHTSVGCLLLTIQNNINCSICFDIRIQACYTLDTVGTFYARLSKSERVKYEMSG